MTAAFVLLRYMLHRFSMTDTWWVAGGSCFRTCEVLPTSCKAFAGALLKLAYATVVCTFLITFSSGDFLWFSGFWRYLDMFGLWHEKKGTWRKLHCFWSASELVDIDSIQHDTFLYILVWGAGGFAELPPVGTPVDYDIVMDSKTGRPRAENVRPARDLSLS